MDLGGYPEDFKGSGAASDDPAAVREKGLRRPEWKLEELECLRDFQKGFKDSWEQLIF